MMFEQARTVFRNTADFIPPLYAVHRKFREVQLLAQYRKRRNQYHRICRERGLVYDEAQVRLKVAHRLRGRSYTPRRRGVGEIHTFAIIPRISWHDDLYHGLKALGPVSEFDPAAEGFDPREVYRAGKSASKLRKIMGDSILKAVRAAHQRRPIDWVFVYPSGYGISPETVRLIQKEIGAPVAGMCLDDKHTWEGPSLGDHRGGQIDIAAVYDLSWTSARIACEWYLAEGGIPIYLPEGANETIYRPVPVESQDIDICFVGGAYGFRKAWIARLRKRGLDIRCYGSGWGPDSFLVQHQIPAIFCRSKIILGHGGVGFSETLTNVKGRDFEAPSTGGGMYLTTFNPDLALHFEVGKEILCYRSDDDLFDAVRYYLDHPAERAAVAHWGRERCLRNHTWRNRFERICEVLGILEDGP